MIIDYLAGLFAGLDRIHIEWSGNDLYLAPWVVVLLILGWRGVRRWMAQL